jgi:hypothetical protein
MEVTDGLRSIYLTRAEAYYVAISIFKTPLTDLYLLGDILYRSNLEHVNVYPWQLTIVQTMIANPSDLTQ